MLERQGYAVAGASNGQVALDVLRNAAPRPELIILDLRMPVMSGEELLKVLAAEAELARIPVIVTSAHAPGTATWPTSVRWFQKPWDPDALLASIVELLGARHEPGR